MDRNSEKQATEANGCAAGSFETPSREKRFGECGLEEKVERLRNVLRTNDNRLDSIAQLAVEARELAHELAHEHSHDPVGRVMRAARDIANKLMRGLEFRNRSPLE